MFFNLLMEMESHKPKITQHDIAACLEVSEELAMRYLNGTSKISWLNTLKIKHTYFPNFEIDYLFATENDCIQKAC